MLKVTIKTVITLTAAGSAGGGPLFKTGIFGAVYVFMTCYVWYIDKRGGFLDFIRKNGPSAALISIGFMFLSPLAPLTAISLIINTIEIGETAGTFISVLITAAGIGCFTRDCIRACHTG